MDLFNKKERASAEVVVQDVVKVKKGERVLIIANPETSEIAQDLFTACSEAGALSTLMYQPSKTSFDNANPEVLAAIASNPDVCFSISNIKLGKDPAGLPILIKQKTVMNILTFLTILLTEKRR